MNLCNHVNLYLNKKSILRYMYANMWSLIYIYKIKYQYFDKCISICCCMTSSKPYVNMSINLCRHFKNCRYVENVYVNISIVFPPALWEHIYWYEPDEYTRTRRPYKTPTITRIELSYRSKNIIQEWATYIIQEWHILYKNNK